MAAQTATLWLCRLTVCVVLLSQPSWGAQEEGVPLTWSNEMLSIRGDRLYGREISVHYLEAFCRPGSIDATGKRLSSRTGPAWSRRAPTSDSFGFVRSSTTDVVVDHEICAANDAIDFRVVATNPRSG